MVLYKLVWLLGWKEYWVIKRVVDKPTQSDLLIYFNGLACYLLNQLTTQLIIDPIH